MKATIKASELILKFIPHTRVFHNVLGWEDYEDSAKQCALILVDEILQIGCIEVPYWQEVKMEIEKL